MNTAISDYVATFITVAFTVTGAAYLVYVLSNALQYPRLA